MRAVAPSRFYRLLYPAVPVVVAASYGRRISAMPAVSVISLSNDPALMGISTSRFHATREGVVKAGCFSVSWLDSRYAEVVELLGRSSGAGIEDKLTAAGLHHRISGSPEVPIIREASAYLQCALTRVERFGDHDLLVAEVRKARAIRDFAGYWEFKSYRPILYSGIGRKFVTE